MRAALSEATTPPSHKDAWNPDLARCERMVGDQALDLHDHDAARVRRLRDRERV